MTRKLAVLLALLPCLQCQMSENLYFPDDNAVQNNFPKEIKATAKDNPSFGSASKYDSNTFYDNISPPGSSISSTLNMREQQHMIKVVSTSVTKLTLAVNKQLIPTIDSRENVVFAPVSIAGK